MHYCKYYVYNDDAVVAMVTAAVHLTLGLKDTSTTVGGSLAFTCEGQGQPPPDYTWYINAQPVRGLSSFTYLLSLITPCTKVMDNVFDN